MAKRLPSTPPVLPGFSYVRPLGTGGFADVFLFEQNLPRREVAVKVLLRDVVDEQVRRMFNAEADVMAQLGSHPSVLTIYEAGISADGRPYIVSEYCPSTLSSRFRRELFSVPELLDVGVRIASAVETAHRAGVLHRDIKPSNILITGYGNPVLADFGIATALDAQPGTDTVVLSVPWSAPEIIEERTSGTVQSELWSLGALLYSLLAGRSPFESTVPGQNSEAHLRARIARARYTAIDRDDIPPRLDALLRGCLRFDPAQRPQHAIVVAEVLRSVQAELGMLKTRLQIADASSPAAARPIALGDDGIRGDVVAPVSPELRRRSRRASDAGRATSTGGRPARSGRSRVNPWLIGIVSTTVLVAFVLVTAVLLLLTRTT